MAFESDQTADSSVHETAPASPASWIRHLGAAAALLMVVPWLVAGIYKLTIVSEFQLMLTQILVPVSLSLVGAVLVIMGDLTAGVLLLVPSWRRLGGIFSSLLLVIFMGYFAVNYETLRGADCSCFPWVERAVGPEFFWSDGVMLLLSIVAAWLAPPLKKIRVAGLTVAGITAVTLAALAVDKLGPRPLIEAPAVVTVDDQEFSLREGKVFVYFFNPMCMHCLDAGIVLAQHSWQAPFVGVPTEEKDLAIGFIEDTGLKDVRLTMDLDVLKEAFPFKDPPYAVAIEDGRLKEPFPFFEEPELGEKLRELGFVE